MELCNLTVEVPSRQSLPQQLDAVYPIVAKTVRRAVFRSSSQIIKLTGQWTVLTNRVNLAVGSMEKGADVMNRVSEMARRTYSDLNLTAEGYMALARVFNDLGVSTDRQLDFVESLNNALVVSVLIFT